MKRKLFLAGIILLMLALGLVVVSCGESGSNRPNQFTGTTWKLTVDGVQVSSGGTLTFTENDFTHTLLGKVAASGPYSAKGTEATLNATVAFNVNIPETFYATAVIDGDTLLLTVDGSPYTYTK